MEEAGLQVRVDAIGNTYGLWEGSDPNLGRQLLSRSYRTANFAHCPLNDAEF